MYWYPFIKANELILLLKSNLLVNFGVDKAITEINIIVNADNKKIIVLLLMIKIDITRLITTRIANDELLSRIIFAM